MRTSARPLVLKASARNFGAALARYRHRISGKINGSVTAPRFSVRSVGHVLYTNANLNLNSRSDRFCGECKSLNFSMRSHDIIHLLKLTQVRSYVTRSRS